MAIVSMLRDFAAPYSPFESWTYDRFIAPAVAVLETPLIHTLLPQIVDGAHVLDVGCGGGHLALKLLAARNDVRVTGVDLSREQINRAERRGADYGERARFVAGSALDLPLQDSTFDAVVSVASIKHWPDPLAGLRELVRVLKPGGTLLVAEADRGCRIDDVRAFAARTGFPAPLRATFVPFFRTVVSGLAPDLDDARGWLATLDLRDGLVERIPGAPALWLRGTKPPAAAKGSSRVRRRVP